MILVTHCQKHAGSWTSTSEKQDDYAHCYVAQDVDIPLIASVIKTLTVAFDCTFVTA